MTNSPQLAKGDAAAALFKDRFDQVKHELADYEGQEKRSRRTDRVVTVCEYVLGGIVTAVPAFQNKTHPADASNLFLLVGLVGALVITAKIVRERFKPGQALMGARFIVATLRCGIMQVENERELSPNWAEKIPDEVEFLSRLIGWVEEVKIAGLANVTQVRRPTVKYLPVGPKASSRKP
ncbi:MAG TPA: hypothetical protein VNN08_22995 [Thermoanaerobaculia bacterium]|nr:hypothetical protein [Thermoanaerobaculia bacterium]